MTAVRRVPAVVLVVVLGLLPLQAWLRVGQEDVRFGQPVEELAGITWAARVANDGTLSVTIVYDLDDQPRTGDIRLPSGSRLLHANGAPVPAVVGRYGEVQTDGTLTVTYERVGAVTRYADGVIVDFAGIESSDQALFACARCYLGVDEYGNTSITGALFTDDVTDARIALSHVEQLRTGIDDGALRFVAALPGAGEAGMIAWLPVAAAPEAPTASEVPGAVTGETAAEVWGATIEASREEGTPLAEADSGPPIGALAGAAVLTIMWVALVGWIVWRLVVARRILAAAAPDAPIVRDADFTPPSRLEPALVSVVVGDTGRGSRSAVAATLLSLALRGDISIDGIDSQRYTLTLPPGVRGDTPFEEAVLSELRPQGQVSSTATMTGPPLWGDAGPLLRRKLAARLAREAIAAKLLRITLTAWVLVPAAVAMGVVALIASGGSSWLAWLVTIVGPIAAIVATVLTGSSLTAKGRAERDLWLAYGTWLRESSELERVGAPGIAIWGEPLVYAAAVGAAPKAAEALSPS